MAARARLNSRLVSTLLWCSTAAAVAAMTLPLSGFSGHPYWNRIQWIPYMDPAGGIEDIAENLLLFAPFGFFLATHWRDKKLLFARVTLCAAALSASGEFYQVFCPSRYPSVTDVLDNSAGALLGALAAGAFGLLR